MLFFIMKNKIYRGQFYTTTNPFNLSIFQEWLQLAEPEIILEPFAGSNNLVSMVKENYLWACFDVDPAKINKVPKFPIRKKNVLDNFPKGYKVAITNPPYLAKNSATSKKLPFPDTKYDNLYKECLNLLLPNCEFVCAIVPNSFINANLFQYRLFAFVELNVKMFEDTDCPVCMVLFMPWKIKDPKIYRVNEFLGTFSSLKDEPNQEVINIGKTYKFNEPNGEVGIVLYDSTKQASIRFVRGEDIGSIVKSGRHLTRVSGDKIGTNLDRYIDSCNEELEIYRNKTKDVFLTTHRGLRKDGQFRRRLSFKQARILLARVYLKC